MRAGNWLAATGAAAEAAPLETATIIASAARKFTKTHPPGRNLVREADPADQDQATPRSPAQPGLEAA
jgi:hypothetical protein